MAKNKWSLLNSITKSYRRGTMHGDGLLCVLTYVLNRLRALLAPRRTWHHVCRSMRPCLMTVFIVASGPYCGSDDENDQSSDNGQAGTTSFPYQCPDGTVQHTTSSGKAICCPENNSQFCDENAEGYTGGCWPEGTDCDAITECGGQYSSCQPGTLPYCTNDQLQCLECSQDSSVNYTASGRPFCCDADFPTFCDETGEGYQGGCWQAGVDCQTIAQCASTWAACPSGMVVFCDTATGQNFCVQS